MIAPHLYGIRGNDFCLCFRKHAGRIRHRKAVQSGFSVQNLQAVAHMVKGQRDLISRDLHAAHARGASGVLIPDPVHSGQHCRRETLRHRLFIAGMDRIEIGCRRIFIGQRQIIDRQFDHACRRGFCHFVQHFGKRRLHRDIILAYRGVVIRRQMGADKGHGARLKAKQIAVCRDQFGQSVLIEGVIPVGIGIFYIAFALIPHHAADRDPGKRGDFGIIQGRQQFPVLRNLPEFFLGIVNAAIFQCGFHCRVFFHRLARKPRFNDRSALGGINKSDRHIQFLL